ncbi:FixH family protein [Virgibacillus sp. W0430]|uniref:FixH family protein n=1 Tax=Virgibacillus sp. W0430 TaxID=3391580 RepID=UPI003F47B25C
MKKILSFAFILMVALLTACGGESENESTDTEEELATLEVDFDLPESAEKGEPVELKATVTYGDTLVEDANEVDFEYWLGDDEDNSTTIASTNNEDGTYTAEVIFEKDGVYSIFAHTTARDMHTMPKKQITIGTGEAHDHEQDAGGHEGHDDEDHAHTNGFHMHFMAPEDVTTAEDTELMVHLQMDDAPLAGAAVRYEIWHENSERHNWTDANETKAGEYVASYKFEQAGTYHIQIHVEDDEDLHEHKEVKVEVVE